jgi:hypothetical protein
VGQQPAHADRQVWLRVRLAHPLFNAVCGWGSHGGAAAQLASPAPKKVKGQATLDRFWSPKQLRPAVPADSQDDFEPPRAPRVRPGMGSSQKSASKPKRARGSAPPQAGPTAPNAQRRTKDGWRTAADHPEFD